MNDREAFVIAMIAALRRYTPEDAWPLLDDLRQFCFHQIEIEKQSDLLVARLEEFGLVSGNGHHSKHWESLS